MFTNIHKLNGKTLQGGTTTILRLYNLETICHKIEPGTSEQMYLSLRQKVTNQELPTTSKEAYFKIKQVICLTVM